MITHVVDWFNLQWLTIAQVSFLLTSLYFLHNWTKEAICSKKRIDRFFWAPLFSMTIAGLIFGLLGIDILKDSLIVSFSCGAIIYCGIYFEVKPRSKLVKEVISH